MAPVQIIPFNENSLLVSFPGLSLQEAHRHVILLDDFCYHNCQQWLTDHFPAYESLLLVCNGIHTIAMVKEALNHFFQRDAINNTQNEAEVITIPVCYDLRLGNDLEQMCVFHGISSETIVACHNALNYHVYMLGFLPGFAYMGEVDERIVTPRKAVPVPTRAGAVGIAGRQTGIYPLDSPGGWNIVGYTPLKMFDINKPTPTLLHPGNVAKFVPIDLITYNSMLEDDGSN